MGRESKSINTFTESIKELRTAKIKNTAWKYIIYEAKGYYFFPKFFKTSPTCESEFIVVFILAPAHTFVF